MVTIVNRGIAPLLFCAVVFVFFSKGANGQGLHEAQKLLASDGQAGDRFGVSVSISGDSAIIGADLDGDAARGSAYVFRRSGLSWIQEQELFPSAPFAVQHFGYSVSINDGVAAVGAWGDPVHGAFSGSGTVFRWDGSSWIEEQKLLPSDGFHLNQFGYSVSVSNDMIVVGTFRDGINNPFSGSVYVFRWDGASWVQEQKLIPSDREFNDHFGHSVSISGDVVLASAVFGAPSGSAYVFRRNGSQWEEEEKLLSSDGESNDQFGYSVALSGDLAVVGARLDDDNGLDSGSAYVFRWTGASWMQEQKLLPSDGTANSQFGFSVAVSTDLILVGAPGSDQNGLDPGSSYLFRWDGMQWVEEKKLLPADAVAAGPQFGWSVAISENVPLVGAPDDYTSGPGSAFVFNLFCPQGYYGPLCLPCPNGAIIPCRNQGMCDDGVDGTGVCTCDAGWTGEDCGTDIDECAEGIDNCDVNATCASTPGSFSCACNPGFTGDGITCVTGAIPTVSGWGLVVLTLVVLVGGKVGFRSRQAA